MKAYLAHNSGHGEDYECALVFAPSRGAAKSFANRILDAEFLQVRVNRWPSADGPDVKDERQATLHEYHALGFHELGEPTCATCGASSFGLGEYLVCDKCHNCRECGCADDCVLRE